jgi:hypothetical protein
VSEPDYRAVLRRLTGLDDEAARLRAEAERWYDDRVAAAGDAVRAAEENVRAAENAVRAAEKKRDDLDARAHGVWSDFTHTVGRRADRFGHTLPEPTVPHQRDRDAEEYLDEAKTLAGPASPAQRRAGGMKPVFAALGVAGGLAGVAGHQLLRWAGREAGGVWDTALPVLALIVLLLTPVLALVIGGRRIADRRGAPLDVSTVATGLIAGLATAALLYTALTVPAA